MVNRLSFWKRTVLNVLGLGLLFLLTVYVTSPAEVLSRVTGYVVSGPQWITSFDIGIETWALVASLALLGTLVFSGYLVLRAWLDA